MSDNNQDRPQDEGQQGIDRETEQRNRENESGQAGSQQIAPGQNDQFGQDGGKSPSDQDRTGFVGSQADQSSDYLTKGEEDQDFAADGQGAQDSDAGRSDIETGQTQDNDPILDDGSDSNR